MSPEVQQTERRVDTLHASMEGQGYLIEQNTAKCRQRRLMRQARSQTMSTHSSQTFANGVKGKFAVVAKGPRCCRLIWEDTRQRKPKKKKKKKAFYEGRVQNKTKQAIGTSEHSMRVIVARSLLGLLTNECKGELPERWMDVQEVCSLEQAVRGKQQTACMDAT